MTQYEPPCAQVTTNTEAIKRIDGSIEEFKRDAKEQHVENKALIKENTKKIDNVRYWAIAGTLTSLAGAVQFPQEAMDMVATVIDFFKPV